MQRAHLPTAVLVAFLVASALPPSAATPEAPERFEVLQAAFHPFGSLTVTHQDLSQRCVLFEHYVGAEGPANEAARNASDAMVNGSPRLALAYAEYRSPHARFVDYYKAQLVPAAVFDGTVWDFGGGQQTRVHYDAALNATEAVPAGASINVSGGIVISGGYLDYEVFSPLNLSAYYVTVRALLVEDHVASPTDGRDLRYLVREYLSGARYDFLGGSAYSGRINFTVDPTWVESQLAAVVFVEVDSARGVDRPAAPPAVDLVGAILVPIAALVTGTTLAVIFVRFVSAERRARLR